MSSSLAEPAASGSPPLSDSNLENVSRSSPSGAEEKKSTTPPPAQSGPPGLGAPSTPLDVQERRSSPPALAPAPATHSDPPPDQASASREPSEADTVDGDAGDPVQQPPLSPYGYAAPPRHVRPYGGPPSPSPGDARETVRCPQALVGRLIGKGGDTIKDLQRRSGARIQIDQNYPEGQPRLVTVEGAAQCVRAGVELVRSLIGNSPAVGNGAPGRLATFECPKGLVGRVIGKVGETINELQRRSGARIQIEQRVAEGEPCVVEVQGDDRAVEEARRLVHEVMGGKRLDPPYVAYAYAAMAQQGAYGFPPQPSVGLASYGQVRRAHAGSFSSTGTPDTPPGSPIPGYAVPHYPYPYYPPYGFPPAQYGPPPPGSPIPGSPVARGWTQHVDATTGRPYWHHPQLGASWSPPPAGPPPRPMPPPQTNGDDAGDDAEAPPAPAPAPNPAAWPHSAWASGAGGAADGDNP